MDTITVGYNECGVEVEVELWIKDLVENNVS